MLAFMERSQLNSAGNNSKSNCLPSLSQILRISVVRNDGVGPATAWILFEFKDGSLRSFLSSLEKRAVMRWFEEFLPQLLNRLKTCLSARPLDTTDITDIYQSDGCW